MNQELRWWVRKMISDENTVFPTDDTVVQAEVQTPPGFKMY